MRPSRIKQRLADLEARARARIGPGDPRGLLQFATDEELEVLEAVLVQAEAPGATEAARLVAEAEALKVLVLAAARREAAA